MTVCSTVTIPWPKYPNGQSRSCKQQPHPRSSPPSSCNAIETPITWGLKSVGTQVQAGATRRPRTSHKALTSRPQPQPSNTSTAHRLGTITMRHGWSPHCLLRQKLAILVAFSTFIILCSLALLWQHGTLPPLLLQNLHAHVHQSAELQSHPISLLMNKAGIKYSELLTKQTVTLHSAAQAYRRARGRHPPPGFDAWFEFAQKHDAVIIEDLFSQIHHDLNPFWAVPPKDLRRFAQNFEHRIYVRNGTASATTYHGPGAMTEWMQAWLDVVRSIESLLPDLDMPVNLMDESRVSMTCSHSAMVSVVPGALTKSFDWYSDIEEL
jgi:hypothetical protein